MNGLVCFQKQMHHFIVFQCRPTEMALRKVIALHVSTRGDAQIDVYPLLAPLEDPHTSRLLGLRPPRGIGSELKLRAFQNQTAFLPISCLACLPHNRLYKASAWNYQHSWEKFRLGYLLESLCQTLLRSRDLRKNIASRYRIIQKSILWRQRQRYTMSASATPDSASSSWFSLGLYRFWALDSAISKDFFCRPSKYCKLWALQCVWRGIYPYVPLLGTFNLKTFCTAQFPNLLWSVEPKRLMIHISFWLQVRSTPDWFKQSNCKTGRN